MQQQTVSHVKVFVRTKPSARSFEGIKTDGQTVTVTFPKQDEGLINNQLERLTLKFDGVLDNASQDAVYDTAVRSTVDSALAGHNATVLAYGQTGAGKTFTMSGDQRAYAHRGVIPRTLQHVFREVDLRSDRIFAIAVSYLEIHNEALRDLLAEDPAASADGLTIVDEAASTVVRGLTKVPVACEEEALRQFFLGEQARCTAQHALNAASSRSHALFTLHIETRASAEADERALLSKLHLVDLAGSERIKKTQAMAGQDWDATHEQLRESACINKSLSFLEQVVNARTRGDAHVPFRQSKLTAVLRDTLGGNGNAVMLACLWPEAAHLEECVSTLRFAGRVRCLTTAAAVNESGDPGLALRKAERQIRELRQELAMRDMLAGRGRVGYEDLRDGERAELQGLVLRYLAGAAHLDELPIDSLKRIRETYKAFKVVSATWMAAAGAAKDDNARASNHASPGQACGPELEAGGVGVMDTSCSSGFCIGTAPLHARPQPSPGVSRSSTPGPGASAASALQRACSQQAAAAAWPPAPAGQPRPSAASAGSSEQPIGVARVPDPAAAAAAGIPGPRRQLDRNLLFSQFKHSVAHGIAQAVLVKQQQQLLAQLKQSIKGAGLEVNAAKAEIDRLAAARDARLANARAAEGSSSSRSATAAAVLDDEAYQLLQQLKTAKARFRDLTDGLNELRASCSATTEGLAAAKEAMLCGFEAWLASNHGQQQHAGAAAAVAGSLDWAAGQQVTAAAVAAAAGNDGLEPEGVIEDPNEVYARAALARKAAAAGDPGSTAYFAAQQHMAKVLNARQRAGV